MTDVSGYGPEAKPGSEPARKSRRRRSASGLVRPDPLESDSENVLSATACVVAGSVEEELLRLAQRADASPSVIDVGQLSRVQRRKLMYPDG